MIEKGGGKYHAPGYKPGCYHERLVDCCSSCFVRLFVKKVAATLYRVVS